MLKKLHIRKPLSTSDGGKGDNSGKKVKIFIFLFFLKPHDIFETTKSF